MCCCTTIVSPHQSLIHYSIDSQWVECNLWKTYFFMGSQFQFQGKITPPLCPAQDIFYPNKSELNSVDNLPLPSLCWWLILITPPVTPVSERAPGAKLVIKLDSRKPATCNLFWTIQKFTGFCSLLIHFLSSGIQAEFYIWFFLQASIYVDLSQAFEMVL